MFARILRQRATALSWRPTPVGFSSTAADADLRTRIMGEIKTAMKNKDSSTSTTLRSVLSEVYNADKAAPEGKVDSEKIATILRKAFDCRSEAVSKFQAASREDLAKKEQKEMDIIAKFLPALLSESDIDAILSPIVKDTPTANPPQKALGAVFKQFYAQVDKSRVDAELLKKRARVLLASNS